MRGLGFFPWELMWVLAIMLETIVSWETNLTHDETWKKYEQFSANFCVWPVTAENRPRHDTALILSDRNRRKWHWKEHCSRQKVVKWRESDQCEETVCWCGTESSTRKIREFDSCTREYVTADLAPTMNAVKLFRCQSVTKLSSRQCPGLNDREIMCF